MSEVPSKPSVKEKPKKKPASAILLTVLFLAIPFLLITGVYYINIIGKPASPFTPREEPYEPFEKHVLVSEHMPFVSTYFLMVPENYQPEKYSYPLVMMLHGAGNQMNGAKFLAHPQMRRKYPAFVLIPFTPQGYGWAYPETADKKHTEALPLAMAALEEVRANYKIHPDMIYVTGLSMGGGGTYGAISRYHDVFAAAVPTDGDWDPNLTPQFDDIPIWIFHGSQDSVISPSYPRTITKALKLQGRTVKYTELTGKGHGVWRDVYYNPQFWAWLFSQKKG